MAAVILKSDELAKRVSGKNSSAQPTAQAAAQPQQQSQYAPKTYQGVALAQTAQQNPYEGPYNILGASAKTQKGLTDYGERYAPSQAVQDARAYLQEVMDGRPGSYGGNSGTNYGAQIAGAYQAAVPQREKFQYDVNKDPMFQQYKNQYMNLGQRAMQDTVGNAAGLTGGYGSSYGTTAGYQAYQQYLQQLNGIVPQLEEQAWQRYKYEGDEARANANAAAAYERDAYNRYRDTVADWQADRDFAATLYGQEHDWDYNDWTNLQDYYMKLAQMENTDFWRTADTLEDNRRYDANLAYQYYGTDLDDRYRYATLAEQGRQFDADDLYRYATLAEQGRTANMDDRYRWGELAEKGRTIDLDDRYRYAELEANQQKTRDALAYQAYKDRMDDAYRWGDLNEQGRKADAELAYKNRIADIEDAYNRDKLSADERANQLQLAQQRYVVDQQNAYNYAEMAEKGRQYDLAYGLDRDKFDFEMQKYKDALEKAGIGSPSGTTTPKDDKKDKSGLTAEQLQEIMDSYKSLTLPGTSWPTIPWQDQQVQVEHTKDGKPYLAPSSEGVTVLDRIQGNRLQNPLKGDLPFTTQQMQDNNMSQEEADQLAAILGQQTGATKGKKTTAEKKASIMGNILGTNFLKK